MFEWDEFQSTPLAPRGGKAPARGFMLFMLPIAPTIGLFMGGGARPPFEGPHVWSIKRVFISGLGRGFLQS